MPVEAYGHAKLAAEWACLQAAAHGLDVTIVRPRTILGHGRLGIFGIFFAFGGTIQNPVDAPFLIIGYAFGASFVALFAQLGGGIYTKAADVGADRIA